jgi:ribose transport system permease protein
MTLRQRQGNVTIFVALAVEFILLAATTDTFLSVTNLANVLRQNAFTAVLAAGMTFVILTGGIDLSVGSVVGLSGVVCAGLLTHSISPVVAIIATLSLAVGIGVINGGAITLLRIPAFIVTLAMMLIARGAAFKYTDGHTITGLPLWFSNLSTTWTSTAVTACVFVLGSVVLTRTPFGRHVYAVGGNREAAWLCGIAVSRLQVVVYAISGLSAGVAGVLVASRLSAGYPRAGEYYELDAIAAVVVGGTSLFGGRGSIWGALAGAFFIGIINNGLNLYQVSTYDQLIVKGLVLVTAASLDRWRTRQT